MFLQINKAKPGLRIRFRFSSCYNYYYSFIVITVCETTGDVQLINIVVENKKVIEEKLKM